MLQHMLAQTQESVLPIRRQARRADRDPLAGRMAHDLRNILQIISGNLTLLSRRVDGDAAAMKHIDRAMAGIDLGTRLAGTVIGRGVGSAQVSCSLPELKSTLEAMLGEALGPGFTLRIDLPAKLHRPAVDQSELENVLLNLAINARDAMGVEGLLTVAFRDAIIGDESAVELSVIDTGCGMPEEVRQRIFEPFFSTKGQKGSGLGLATVKRFADDCGGTVEVESKQGVGTTFRIVLPAICQS